MLACRAPLLLQFTHALMYRNCRRCITRSDMLALVEKYPDLGQDLAKYVLEREEQKVPDTIKQESAGYLVRCKRFHVSCASLCVDCSRRLALSRGCAIR